MCVVSLCGKLSEKIDFEVRKKKFDEKKKVNLPIMDHPDIDDTEKQTHLEERMWYIE